MGKQKVKVVEASLLPTIIEKKKRNSKKSFDKDFFTAKEEAIKRMVIFFNEQQGASFKWGFVEGKEFMAKTLEPLLQEAADEIDRLELDAGKVIIEGIESGHLLGLNEGISIGRKFRMWDLFAATMTGAFLMCAVLVVLNILLK